MYNTGFEYFTEYGLPSGWQKSYVIDPLKIAALPVCSFTGTGQAVRLNCFEANTGIMQRVGNVENFRDPINFRVNTKLLHGKIGLQICNSNETSVYFGDRLPGKGVNWAYLSGIEVARFLSTPSGEIPTKGQYDLMVQKSYDCGKTWGKPVTVKRLNNIAFYPTGTIYFPDTDEGLIFYIQRNSGTGNAACFVMKLINRMTKVKWDKLLRGDYTFSEARPIILQTGTVIYPVNFGPAGANDQTFNMTPAVFRTVDRFETFQFIPGISLPKLPRGFCEPVAVELTTGNVLIVANSTSGYLVREVFSHDGLIPYPPEITNIQSPRSKHDVLRLSDGTIALAWSSNQIFHGQDANYPRAVVMLAFSTDDMNTLIDFHTIDINHLNMKNLKSNQLYEIYLEQQGDKLRVSYWEYCSSLGKSIAYCKEASLKLINGYRMYSKDCTLPWDGVTTLNRIVEKKYLNKQSLIKLTSIQVPLTIAEVDNLCIMHKE